MTQSPWIYAQKAAKYARYRWDYAPEAVDALCAKTGITPFTRLADLGAGTGILTRALARRVAALYAVEPDPEMLHEAKQTLAAFSNCTLVAAPAEATTLADASIDVVTVAQAVHWFSPEPFRAELHRILKPGGWLALLRNYGTDARLGLALSDLNSPAYGAVPSPRTPPEAPPPPDFYFGAGGYQKFTFPFVFKQPWLSFLGGLSSASYLPDEGDPLFTRFECAARQIFDHFGDSGILSIAGETELIVGQPQ